MYEYYYYIDAYIIVAFCFYNLSSIANGLVYFNQFSLIPPVHLNLVILGIIVLLGGVWIVSIRSGGGGVDIGAWTDETELPKEDLLDVSVEGREPQDLEGGRSDILIKPDVGKDVDVIESELAESRTASASQLEPCGTRLRSSPQIPVSRPAAPRIRTSFTSSRQGQPRDSTSRSMSLYPSLRYTTMHRRQSTLDTPVSYLHSHRSTSFTVGPSTVPYTRFLRAQSSLGLNAVATLSAGIQIGLSPVSPGFAIIPRERRRSGLDRGIGFPELVQDAMGDQELEWQRRRTVSEGDVGTRSLATARGQRFRLDEGPGQGISFSEGNEEEEGILSLDRDRASVPGKGKGTKKGERSRWRWLKGVIMRR